MRYESLRREVTRRYYKCQPAKPELNEPVVQAGDYQSFVVKPGEKGNIAKAVGAVIARVDNPADNLPIPLTPEGGEGAGALPTPVVSRHELVYLIRAIRKKAQKSVPSITRKSHPR